MSAQTHLPSAMFSLIHRHNKCVFTHVSGKLLRVFVDAGQHVMYFFFSLSTADLMIFNIWNGITTVGNFRMDYRETGNPLIPSLCSARRLTRCSYCEAQYKSSDSCKDQRFYADVRVYIFFLLYYFINYILQWLEKQCSQRGMERLGNAPPIKAKKIKEKLIRALSLFLSAKYFPLT